MRIIGEHYQDDKIRPDEWPNEDERLCYLENKKRLIDASKKWHDKYYAKKQSKTTTKT